MAASETFPFSLSGTSIQGDTVELDALKGKVLIVDVWGTWCPPCRAEIPFFVQLQEKFGTEGFQMIGINYERQGSDEKNREAVVKFIEEFGINYPCIMGDDATREQIPNLTGFPTTLFIDAEGTVRLKAVGLHEYEYLEAVVQELLSQS
jgi:thiol-disulfide isomerase/thioredoxin